MEYDTHAPLPVDWSWSGAPDRGAKGEEGLVGGIGWLRQARASDSGVPVGRGMGQQGNVLMASHQGHARGVSGSSPMAGEDWREGGGSCPSMSRPNLNLVHGKTCE